MPRRWRVRLRTVESAHAAFDASRCGRRWIVSSAAHYSQHRRPMRRRHSRTLTTILLVDDDHEFRSILGEVLRDEQCVVAQAENGARALEMLEAFRPDLVVVDLAMPVMDGAELMLALQGDARLADIPVAVLSASSPVEPVAPGTRVLRKPLDLPNLLGLLEACRATREPS